MADTLQIVQWTLEQTCQLRTGQAVDGISAASAAVGAANQYGRSLAKPDGRFGIYGDVYVTSVTSATLPNRLEAQVGSFIDRFLHPEKAGTMACGDYPDSGYVISEKFKGVGGPAGLEAMCRNCPANTARPFPAGCTGQIAQRPWCGETQEHLAAIVSRLGLSAAIGDTFVTTTPIWFGLWARSPLSPNGARLLDALLTGLIEVRGSGPSQSRRGSWRDGFDTFIAATRIAESGAMKLHIRMAPPGHTDFGWYTIFPHCPLCKAEADVERWKRKYPAAPYNCKVCGTRYSPAETASSTRDDFSSEPELREVLGEERFREFSRAYLVKGGLSEPDAAETVELSEASHVEGLEIAARSAREDNARRRYIEQSLYAGLCIESIAIPGDPDRESMRGFRAAEFEKLIRRCAERNIEITGMNHHSSSEDLERHIFPRGKVGKGFDPSDTLRRWQAEGCNELFAAYLEVPEPLIKAFENENP